MEKSALRISTRTLTQYALFIGIILLLGLTQLGYIPLPFASFTIVHVPVIVGSFVFGKKGGMVLGAFFGLTSFINCFIRPGAIAVIVLGANTGFGLYNLFLIIAVLFVPRILVGLSTGLTYQALSGRNSTLAMSAAGLIGSLTNTVLVLGALYIFAFRASGAAFGLNEGFAAKELLAVLLSIVVTNSIGEAILAVILSTAIGRALLHYMEKRSKE